MQSKDDSVYVPYRNSMMTMVLRDSLGGNCKTKMIATLSPNTEDLYESLSTCRFARSVSLIQNKITRNERVDPGIIISRLKKEVAELKAELAMAKGGAEQRDHLSGEDIERCNLMVKDFIDTNDPSKTLVLPDRLMINQCFYHFKTLFKQIEKKKGGAGVAGIGAPLAIKDSRKEKDDDAASEASVHKKGDDPQSQAEVQRLNLLVKQRDNEIGILLNYLNKKKEQGGATMEPGDVPVTRAPGAGQDPGVTQSSGFNSSKEEAKQGTLFQMMSNGKS